MSDNNSIVPNPIISNRCQYIDCSRKLKLTSFQCRCEKIFCENHRIPESHNCNFDYKTLGKKQLQNANIQVIHEKIIKI